MLRQNRIVKISGKLTNDWRGSLISGIISWQQTTMSKSKIANGGKVRKTRISWSSNVIGNEHVSNELCSLGWNLFR